MSKIWIVAQNPKTELNVYMPLYKTKSLKTLRKWAPDLNKNKLIASNASLRLDKPVVTEDDLKRLQTVYKDQKPKKVVALGRIASETLKRLNIEHFEAPHPSGLNRKLNDKKYVDKMIKDLRRYLNENI